MSTNRQLVAIMFTDIVGYTAMMNEDELGAIKIRKRHREVFEKEHQNCNGTIVQYYGDGTLSTFKSAVEAVDCAIRIQLELQSDIIVPLRIGIHLGDIVFDDSEVYGDGVNVASRVETLGVPGCILISEHIKKAIQSHVSFLPESLGHFEFKNVKDPIEVFAISNTGIKVPEHSELKGKLSEKDKSVAVLPFVNMSADPDNEYFSDGIAEEILNALVKVSGLQVTARTSSFAFKGKNLDVRAIGQQLGAKHILEGSVRKAGNRVRITAQLVSSIDGYHFFSETYDRTLEDIFAVQDEIAQKITNRLREHLGEAQHHKPLVSVPTSNMEAYEMYLKGLFYYNQWGEMMVKAIPYFEKAIELQPDFAQPHACLTLCYYFKAFVGQTTWDEAFGRLEYHVSMLKKFDAQFPEAFYAYFVYHFFVKWEWEPAVEYTVKALNLFPNHARLYHLLSTLYWIKGDLKNVKKAHSRGLQLDPMSIEMNLYMGVIYLWAEDFAKALFYFDKTLHMVPTHRAAKEYTGWVAAFQSDYDKAINIFNELEPFGYYHHQSTCLGWVYHKLGAAEKAAACLETVKHFETTPNGKVLAIDLAILYTCFGDFDNAFFYLEKAILNRVGSVMLAKADFWLKPLQSDPRFKDIEALIGEMPEIKVK